MFFNAGTLGLASTYHRNGCAFSLHPLYLSLSSHRHIEKHPRHTRSQRPAGLYLLFVVSTCLCAGSTFMDMSGSEATASLSESLAVIKRCDGSIQTLGSNGEIK